ncbi:MAG: MotA/TolQ/ExbB proton channel family protein [Thiomicrorhabdus chilensis]|uniref:motility protein A n=1 Tax=Thiomicrorhabdus chilensis TaxID=63656 RepID=UPI00299CD5E9|nr:MotA/TolQ/ExbB proton channel family protein [Thiomicrorhabdus chilensis]MDX1347984.1 MotA/TolQ/ExbB proton channel family protein [Thiomicrorhabdus chilensis]
MRISLSALMGFFLGLGLFALAVYLNTENYLMFFSISSLLMVFGGTMAVAMISFEGRNVMLAFKEIIATLTTAKVDPRTLYEDVGVLIDWAKIVRRESLRKLENTVSLSAEDDQNFLGQCFVYLLSGYRGDKLRVLLQHAQQSIYERKMTQSKVLMTMASASPAFGMIGTLVGLIIMLNNMNGDPSKIGAGLAVALLTTLYGVLMAQLIFKPAARKVEHKQELEAYRNKVLTEGVVLLSDGVSPAHIEDAMNAYLEPKYQFKRA